MFRLFLKKYIDDCEGITAIEYGLIVGAISVMIVVSIFVFGEELESAFGHLADSMTFIATTQAENKTG